MTLRLIFFYLNLNYKKLIIFIFILPGFVVMNDRFLELIEDSLKIIKQTNKIKIVSNNNKNELRPFIKLAKLSKGL